MGKTLYIHIGTEKTGTSAIQNFLFQNQSKLSENGLRYLKTGLVGNNHLLFTLLAAPYSPKTFEIKERINVLKNKNLENRLFELKQNLAEEFKSFKNNDILLISSEHLSSRLDNEKQIQRIKDIFENFGISKFEILIYLRRQDLLIPSYISTSLRVGNPQSFNVLEVNDSWLNYKSIVDLWSKVFGKGSIVIKEYNLAKFENFNIVIDFLQHIPLNIDLSKFSIKTFPMNKSLSGIKLAYLELLNKKRQFFSSKNLLFRDIVKNLENIPDSNFTPREFKIGRINQKKIFNRYKTSNEELATIYLENRRLFTYELADHEFDKIPYLTIEEMMIINLMIFENLISDDKSITI